MEETLSSFHYYPAPVLMLKGKNIIQLNPKAECLLACTNFKTKNVFSFFEMGEAFAQKLEKFLNESPAKAVEGPDGPPKIKGKLSYRHRIFQATIGLFSQDGGEGLFTLFLKDITDSEQKQRHFQELSEQKAFFHSLLKHYADPFLLLDDSSKIEYANPAFMRFFQLDQVPLEEKFLSQLPLAEELRKSFQDTYERAKQNHSFRQRLSTSEGFDLELFVSKYKLHNGKEKWLLNCKDLSVYAETLKSLKQSEAEWRSLAENSPDIVAKFDTQYRLLYINKAVENFMETNAERLLGKSVLELKLPEELIRLFQEELRFVFENGKPRRVEFMLPNGEFVDWQLAPVFDEQGKVLSVVSNARDLTDLKKIENRLRLSQDELNFALQISNMAYWDYDIHREKMSISPQVAHLLGIPDEEYEPVMDFYDVVKRYVVPEDQQKLLLNHRMILQRRISESESEFKVIRKGEVRYLKAYSKIFYEGKDERSYNFGVIQDITEYRKRQNELLHFQTKLEELVESQTKALKISEERMSDAIKLAALGRWELELGSEVVSCDEQVAQMLGMPAEKKGEKFRISLRKVWTMLNRKDLVAFKRMQSKAVRTPAEAFFEQFEIRVELPGQDVKFFLITVKSRKETTYPFKRIFYGNFQDITHIRYAEMDEKELGDFIDAAAYWVAIADSTYHLTYLNPSAQGFFGLKENELQGFSALKTGNAPAIGIFDEDQLQQARQKGIWKGESTLMDFDGRSVPVSQVVIAHRGIAGEVFCYSTIISDLTEFKKVQLDLLTQKNELDTFIYHASHDLKGPVATLKGLNQLIEQEFKDPVALKYFRLYNAETEKLYNILMSLIKLASIKDKELKKIPILFGSLIDNALQGIAGLPGFEEIDFQKEILLTRAYYGDFNMLQMLLEQLLKNTVTFRRKDGKAQTLIRVTEEEGQLWLEVNDNGQGMDKEIQDKVFNMFYRGTEKAKGSGLGLYLVWNIVEKLKGEIVLDSQVEEGTRFLIKLPF
jgi:PAS domain S-box-containing protein